MSVLLTSRPPGDGDAVTRPPGRHHQFHMLHAAVIDDPVDYAAWCAMRDWLLEAGYERMAARVGEVVEALRVATVAVHWYGFPLNLHLRIGRSKATVQLRSVLHPLRDDGPWWDSFAPGYSSDIDLTPRLLEARRVAEVPTP